MTRLRQFTESFCPSNRPAPQPAGAAVRSGFATRPRTRGFSLVEIMVTIGIISLLAALAIPTMKKIQQRSRATAVANDLRVFASAFEAYAQERGNWPAETDAGLMPAEMAGRLNETAWKRITPIGGRYNWESGQMHYGTRYTAVIQISSTSDAPLTQDADLWETLDRIIDNGDLTSGNFRLGTDDEPIFIVSP